MQNPAEIKVSCLMVTLPVPDRLERLKAAIECYLQQTHANRELLIISNGGTAEARHAIAQLIESLDRKDIRLIEPEGDLRLGQLRNISLAEATGAVVCQWDDDDLYHPDRISAQLEALLKDDADAVWLSDVFQYFPQFKTLYWTNWHATEAQGHPGSLMVRAAAMAAYPEVGPHVSLGEDLQIALTLKAHRKTVCLPHMPHLFIYTSHGQNSWNDDHHRMLAEKLSISKGLLTRREAQIRAGLAPIDLGSETIEVHGNNGLVFTLNAPLPK